MMDREIALPDTAFWRAYQGRFNGILTWPAYDALWDLLRSNPTGWYVFEMNNDTPTNPLSEDAFQSVLEAADEMYIPVRRNSLCGAVYVDLAADPAFLKVFDPYRMGGVCGDSGRRTLPRWTFSRIKPDPLPVIEPPTPRRGLIARLTG